MLLVNYSKLFSKFQFRTLLDAAIKIMTMIFLNHYDYTNHYTITIAMSYTCIEDP